MVLKFYATLLLDTVQLSSMQGKVCIADSLLSEVLVGVAQPDYIQV